MNVQFKKGIIELCIMKILSRDVMSAYEVLSLISRDLDVNENTVYPILRRLEKEALVECEKKNSPRGAPRKYFHLTEAGTHALQDLETAWHDFNTRVSSILKGGVNHE